LLQTSWRTRDNLGSPFDWRVRLQSEWYKKRFFIKGDFTNFFQISFKFLSNLWMSITFLAHFKLIPDTKISWAIPKVWTIIKIYYSFQAYQNHLDVLPKILIPNQKRLESVLNLFDARCWLIFTIIFNNISIVEVILFLTKLYLI
jgi:hypothetical protein